MGVGIVLAFLSFSALFGSFSCEGDTWSWKDCWTYFTAYMLPAARKGDGMKILKVTLPSHTQNIDVSYSLDGVVTNGSISVNVTYGVVPSYFNTVNLCTVLKCPVEKGNGSFTLTNPIEPYFHPGHYTLYAVVKNMKEAELACIKVEVQKT